jgi:hypothetical protein
MRITVALLFAAALAVAPGAGAADGLGRLFTTPAQRAQLDDARRSAPEQTVAAEAARPAARTERPQESPGALTVRGVVERSDGRSTAWINDANTYQGDVGAAHRHVDRAGIAGDAVTLKLEDGQATVKMKVGQTLDPASARIRDLAMEAEGAAAAADAPPPEDDDDE